MSVLAVSVVGFTILIGVVGVLLFGFILHSILTPGKRIQGVSTALVVVLAGFVALHATDGGDRTPLIDQFAGLTPSSGSSGTGAGGTVPPGNRFRPGAPTVNPQEDLDPSGRLRGICGPRNQHIQVPDGGEKFADWLESQDDNGYIRRFLHGNAGLRANRDWFQFEGDTNDDVREWWGNTEVVVLTEHATIMTSYCTPDAVMVWKMVTLLPGERVHVINVDGERRIVARGGCKNLALPVTPGTRRRVKKPPRPVPPTVTTPPPIVRKPPAAQQPPPTVPPRVKKPKCPNGGQICGTPTSGPEQNPRKSPGPTPGAPPRDHAENVTTVQQPGSGGDTSGRTPTPKGTDTGSPQGGAPGQTGADETTGEQGGNGTVTNPPTPPPNPEPTTGDPCNGDPNACGGG